MTAVNIVLQRQRGAIMTDALFIDYRTGAPIGFQDKCVAVPELRMAVASRGDARVPGGVAHGLRLFYDGMDGMLADDGQAVRDQYEAWVASFNGEVFSAAVEIMVVGWSDAAARPVGMLFKRDDAGAWLVAPIDPDDVFVGPMLEDREYDRLETAGAGVGTAWNLATFDPIRHGIPIMEAQRRMKLRLPVNAALKIDAHIVGGHILLTEVTATGVEQRIVHQWPDVEGEPVQPVPFVAPRAAVPPVGLNRQQRRAWERRNAVAA